MGWAPGLLLEARGDAPLRLVLPERAMLAPARSGAGWERSEGSSISWLTAIKTLWIRTCKALLTSCSQTSWAMKFFRCHSFCIVGNAGFHCSGGSWHPPQTHVLAHVFVFVFWNRKGWMLLSCPNKNPSVGAACLRSGARHITRDVWADTAACPAAAWEMLARTVGTTSPTACSLFLKNWATLSGGVYAPCSLTEIPL